MNRYIEQWWSFSELQVCVLDWVSWPSSVMIISCIVAYIADKSIERITVFKAVGSNFELVRFFHELTIHYLFLADTYRTID